MMLNPGASSISDIICACTSVGKPAYGSVVMSTDFNCPVRRTVMEFPLRSIFTPASRNLSSTACMCSGRAPIIFTSPFVAAAAMANVAASMRSGITSCSAPCNSFTPVIVIVGPPTPSIFAPIASKNFARSVTSGSHAALSMIVTPSAKTAAIITFAVPSTVGPERPPKNNSAPTNRGARAQT